MKQGAIFAFRLQNLFITLKNRLYFLCTLHISVLISTSAFPPIHRIKKEKGLPHFLKKCRRPCVFFKRSSFNFFCLPRSKTSKLSLAIFRFTVPSKHRTVTGTQQVHPGNQLHQVLPGTLRLLTQPYQLGYHHFQVGNHTAQRG